MYTKRDCYLEIYYTQVTFCCPLYENPMIPIPFSPILCYTNVYSEVKFISFIIKDKEI